MVHFKEKNFQVHFKYEHLPTFYFVCGRIGHELTDFEVLGDLAEEGFEDMDSGFSINKSFRRTKE